MTTRHNRLKSGIELRGYPGLSYDDGCNPGFQCMSYSTEHRQGVIAALLAFGFWGVAPIYFKWFGAVSPYEIIAHRIVWSVVFVAGFLLLRDGPAFWRRMQVPWRTLAWLWLSGTLVAFNWLIFVWAVVNDRVLSTSLGYFINPLVNVLLGMLFLGERLSWPRWLAVAIAAAATTYLGIYLGQPPWIALMLAFSFGLYGLIRKQLDIGPIIGLLWETLLLCLPALAFLLIAGLSGGLTFLTNGTGNRLLLIFSGLVTVLPLIGFAFAARRLSLSVLGFFQYLAPSISFMLAVFLFDEPFTLGHRVAFAGIWLALLIFSLDPVFRSRRERLPM